MNDSISITYYRGRDCWRTIDPRAQGPYRREEVPHGLLRDYTSFELATSAVLLPALVAAHAPTGWAVSLANSVVETTRARERGPSRFERLDRVHDLFEGAQVLAQMVRRLTAARHEHTVPFVQTETARQAARTSVANTLQAVVELVVLRWVPGVQNVVCRLPYEDREAAAEEANEAIRLFLTDLDRTREEYRDIETEAARWGRGVGCLDLALTRARHLFEWGCALAPRIVGVEDRTSVAVRANAARSAVLLDEARARWLEATEEALRNDLAGSNRLLDAVRFGYRHRGFDAGAAPVVLEVIRWAG